MRPTAYERAFEWPYQLLLPLFSLRISCLCTIFFSWHRCSCTIGPLMPVLERRCTADATWFAAFARLVPFRWLQNRCKTIGSASAQLDERRQCPPPPPCMLRMWIKTVLSVRSSYDWSVLCQDETFRACVPTVVAATVQNIDCDEPTCALTMTSETGLFHRGARTLNVKSTVDKEAYFVFSFCPFFWGGGGGGVWNIHHINTTCVCHPFSAFSLSQFSLFFSSIQYLFFPISQNTDAGMSRTFVSCHAWCESFTNTNQACPTCPLKEHDRNHQRRSAQSTLLKKKLAKETGTGNPG